MGCWNGTCGLSGLPVFSGDKILVFPIVETNQNSFSYASALFRPSVLSFRAEYNDYGAGEDCNGVALDYLVDTIRDKLVEMEVGENKYHDIAVKREEFDVDKFFEACHEQRLYFKNPMYGYKNYLQTTRVFFTMIREDVVNRLWNEWTFDMWRSDNMKVPEGFETDEYYIKNVTYAKLAELIPDYLEKLYSISSTIPAPSRIKFSLHNEHILSNTWTRISTGGEFSPIFDVFEQVISAYETGNRDLAYSLMENALVGIMVNSFMESTRKVWLPPMHQGSQSENLDEYKLLNSIVNDVIVERERELYWYD